MQIRYSLGALAIVILALSGCSGQIAALPTNTTEAEVIAPVAAIPSKSMSESVEESEPIPDAEATTESVEVVEPEAVVESVEVVEAEGPSEVVRNALERSWGVAPELVSDTWLNSEPLKLAELRGKVVLVEFWTFGCINCVHVIPAMQEWQSRFGDEGLVIIGVHTPEFAYERETAQVEAALVNLGVTWPVALDNEKVNWRAYQNRYWPMMYLVDKEGVIRYMHIGEGQYDTTAAVIEELLKES